MNSQPTTLMARASIAIEQQPHRLTKIQLAKRIGGKRRRALEAVDLLCSQGYAATTAGPRGWLVYHSLKRYPDEQTDPGTGIPLQTGTDGVPDGSWSAPEQTASPSPAKDGEVRPTATGATNGGEPAPVCQPRCKVCKSPALLKQVNTMLANGFTTAAILDAIAPINAGLAPKSRITNDSLHRHRHRHFPVQAGASGVWRRLLEVRAAEDAADFERGVLNLVTPRAYLEVMVTKAFAGLAAEGAEIAPELGLRAAGELGKLTAQDDDQARWAKVHSQQQRIIEVMKSLAPALQDEVLAKLDGRPWSPPPGGTRLALVEAAPAGDDVFDRFDETDFEDDDDDD